jgi:hypothetical protein
MDSVSKTISLSKSQLASIEKLENEAIEILTI